MQAAYFPFTYLSDRTARRLSALVGPVVVYQPLETAIPPLLSDLASRGTVALRTPIRTDEDRLRAALAEFTEWARLNPSTATAGSGFVGARQGDVPFFDDTTINRIRSDIRRHGQAGPAPDEADYHFSSRLFLALAQDNDQTVDSLGDDLSRVQAKEKAFLATLGDANDAEFSRQALGGTVWREDPGARLTGQRIRAWAGLAAADEHFPEVLITTSSAVIDTLLEANDDTSGFRQLIGMHLDLPTDASEPILNRVLSGFVDGTIPLSAQHADLNLPTATAGSDAVVAVTLYAVMNQVPANWLRGLAPGLEPLSPVEGPAAVGHTLVVLVET